MSTEVYIAMDDYGWYVTYTICRYDTNEQLATNFEDYWEASDHCKDMDWVIREGAK
jgi:hypothetical protein